MKALLVSLGFLVSCSTALGQLPHVVSYQGFIRIGDEPVNDPAANLVLRIYEAAEFGEPVWVEEHTGVIVEDGVFSVLLGSMNPAPFQELPFGHPLWLGVAIGEAEEMVPRTPLVAVPYSLVARGVLGLRIEPTPEPSGWNVMLGHGTNGLAEGVVGATISGGGHNDGSTEIWPNRVEEDYGTVGGGRNNRATGFGATVSGGTANRAAAEWAAVAGGTDNVASSFCSTVGGGRSNVAFGVCASVGGGDFNSTGGSWATVGGGYSNVASEWYATIGGGLTNVAGGYATVGGGHENVASGTYATVVGGGSNVASGHRATVAGGGLNHARGDHSFAAGYNARARHVGSFVWNDLRYDALSDSLLTTADNQFLIHAAGGVGIGTNAPGADVHIYGDSQLARPHLFLQETGPSDFARLRMQNSDSGADYWDIAAGGSNTDRLNVFTRGHNVVTYWPHHIDYVNLISTSVGAVLTQGGVWQNNSSRSSKTDFRKVDTDRLLQGLSELPISSWRYIVESETVRHVGPVAEDFYAAFGLGTDDRSIGTVDADGIALAAIQGLYRLLKEQRAEIETLRARVALLEEIGSH